MLCNVNKYNIMSYQALFSMFCEYHGCPQNHQSILLQIHTIFVAVRLFHDDGLLLISVMKIAIWGQNGVDISCELITYAIEGN
jgi:hypothetical protein